MNHNKIISFNRHTIQVNPRWQRAVDTNARTHVMDRVDIDETMKTTLELTADSVISPNPAHRSSPDSEEAAKTLIAPSPWPAVREHQAQAPKATTRRAPQRSHPASLWIRRENFGLMLVVAVTLGVGLGVVLATGLVFILL